MVEQQQIHVRHLQRVQHLLVQGLQIRASKNNMYATLVIMKEHDRYGLTCVILVAQDSTFSLEVIQNWSRGTPAPRIVYVSCKDTLNAAVDSTPLHT